VVIASLALLWVHHSVNAAFFAPIGIFIVVVVVIHSGILWMKEWGPRLLARKSNAYREQRVCGK